MVTVSFMTPNLVLAGAASGYAGRPDFVFAPPETAPRFEFKYQDEESPLLSCPIMADDPSLWPPAPADIAACDADPDCRAKCERLVLSRRARRSFYMTDGCLAITTASGEAVTAPLMLLTDFEVTVYDAARKQPRTWLRRDGSPRVVLTDPLQAHIDMWRRWTDDDLHDMTAFLATLK